MTHGGKRPGAGRPHGTKNRTSEEIREYLRQIIVGRLSEIESDLALMKPEVRVKLIIELSKFVVSPAMVPERLGEHQLKQVVEYLEKKYKENATS